MSHTQPKIKVIKYGPYLKFLGRYGAGDAFGFEDDVFQGTRVEVRGTRFRVIGYGFNVN